MLTKTRERAASLGATIGCLVAVVVVLGILVVGVLVLRDLVQVAGGG